MLEKNKSIFELANFIKGLYCIHVAGRHNWTVIKLVKFQKKNDQLKMPNGKD